MPNLPADASFDDGLVWKGQLMRAFGDAILWWDLTDDDDHPLPPNVYGLAALDEFGWYITEAWIEHSAQMATGSA